MIAQQLDPSAWLRHYELGRLRMAARVVIVLAPIVALCLLEPIGREACVCCAALLLAVSVWLRFRNRAGVESVSIGLLAGGIPLVAVLVLARLDPGCATAGLVSYCTGFSLLVGAAAGAVVALCERGNESSSGHWLLAIGVALPQSASRNAASIHSTGGAPSRCPSTE